MKKIALILVGLLLGITVSANATLVQLNTDGVAGYDVTGVSIFDWSARGSLVIEQILVGSSNNASTLAQFFADPTLVSGVSNLTFKIHAQSFLTALQDNAAAPILGTGLNSSFEITGVLDGIETATYYNLGGEQALKFTGITGTFEYYFDTNVNAIISTGAGFNDGDLFLSGTLGGSGGLYNGYEQSGNSKLKNVIGFYDKDYIDVDPNTDPSVILIGSTYDSEIKIDAAIPALEMLQIGGVVGNAPYKTQTYANGLLKDLILSADANSIFSAASVPEPATMLLFGIGLLGLSGVARRKK